MATERAHTLKGSPWTTRESPWPTYESLLISVRQTLMENGNQFMVFFLIYASVQKLKHNSKYSHLSIWLPKEYVHDVAILNRVNPMNCSFSWRTLLFGSTKELSCSLLLLWFGSKMSPRVSCLEGDWIMDLYTDGFVTECTARWWGLVKGGRALGALILKCLFLFMAHSPHFSLFLGYQKAGAVFLSHASPPCWFCFGAGQPCLDQDLWNSKKKCLLPLSCKCQVFCPNH